MTKIILDLESATLDVTIAKTETVAVDTGKLNEAVLRYVFNYGLKQILNDAGSSGKSAEEKVAMAEKKLASLYEGTIRAARGGKPGQTPLEVEVERLARAEVTAAIKASGRKVKDVEEDKLEAAIERHADKHADRLKAEAEVILRRKRDAAAVTVDLDDLDL